MLKRNRGTVHTVGLIGTAVLAVGLAYCLITDANRLQIGYEKQATDNAEKYAGRADEAIEHSCSLVPLKERPDCVGKERQAAREGQHDEADLQAQLVTSVWTRYMGIAAIVGMAVGVIGAGLIFVTFRETRESARAALAQVKLMKDAQRPDVHFIELFYNEDTGTHLAAVGKVPRNRSYVQVIAKNFGSGTATVIGVWFGYAVGNDCPQKISYPHQPMIPVNSTLIPDGTSPTSRAQIDLSDGEVAQLQAGEFLFFWMKGEFKDALGGTHTVGIGAYWANELAGREQNVAMEMIGGAQWAVIPDRPDLNFRDVTEGLAPDSPTHRKR